MYHLSAWFVRIWLRMCVVMHECIYVCVMYDWYDLLYVCVYVITFVYDECTCMHVLFVCNVSSVGMGCVYMPTYVRDLYDTSAVCDYLSMYECIVHVPLTLAHPQLCIFLDFMRYVHVELCTRTLHAHTAHIRCKHSTRKYTHVYTQPRARRCRHLFIFMYIWSVSVMCVCIMSLSLSLCICMYACIYMYEWYVCVCDCTIFLCIDDKCWCALCMICMYFMYWCMSHVYVCIYACMNRMYMYVWMCVSPVCMVRFYVCMCVSYAYMCLCTCLCGYVCVCIYVPM